ncbi:MAG: YihY/virulence factor BrkB family protein [Myxococcales bacterium]|nr:YihY/virulence factor BrkB family protein [Myxococcales bacterium]
MNRTTRAAARRARAAARVARREAAKGAVSVGALIVRGVREFLADQPFVLAAALSYYSLLSLAPLVLVIASIAGFLFGPEAAEGEVVTRIVDLVGPEAATLIEGALAHAHRSGTTWLSALLGGAGVILGATTAFAQLQHALNQIWGVEPPKRPILGALWTRALSFLFVALLGLAVVALLVASSVLSALQASPLLGQLSFAWRLLDLALPLLLMTGLFAALFRWLPDARIRWRDVWVGAAMTSTLFIVGRLGIGLYIGRAGVGSAYGAAGALVVVMVWTYYSALIVLFGAELTQVFSAQHGSGVEPIRGAHLRSALVAEKGPEG